MKRLFLIFLTLSSLVTAAQQYNNEWIDYSKTYYKFKVGSTGLYRIPQTALAGIGLGATDAAHFQLWRNGVEVPLYTTSQAGVLPAAGYIEFWGEANDGKPDNILYRNSADQINDSRSLFTDTAAYFLTINATGANKRLLPAPNSIPTGVAAEPYFMHTNSTFFNEGIFLGKPEGVEGGYVYTSSYEGGKGWASADLGNGGVRSFSENLYAYKGTGAPDVQVKMNAVGNRRIIRNVKLSVNSNPVFDNTITDFSYARFSTSMPASILTGTADNFSITNSATELDRVRIAMVELTYARAFNFGGASNFKFSMPASASGKYLEISGFTFSGVPVLYDLTNGRRYEADVSNPSLIKVFIQPSAISQQFVMVSQAASNAKTITTLESRNFVNYMLPANQGDYLMITNNAVLTGSNGSQPVEAYRAYRSSAAGGAYNAKVYMIDQLTDQFAFGIKSSPLAIRNFLRAARSVYTVKPKQAFIIGKGVTYTTARTYENLPFVNRVNLVPSFGHPSSDVLLSAEGASSRPLTPIGRVSVVNGNELQIYLDKVIQYEQALATISPLADESAWKKNVIHMVGANDQPTIDYLYQLLNNHKAIIKEPLYGAHVTDFVKSYNTVQEQLTSERLANLINGGVNMLSFFGHSSTTSLGFNLDDPANYNNYQKYPLFNMMGCDVGNIFVLSEARLNGPDVLSEKYVLAKDRGCIGMMAGTSVGYISPLDMYNTNFYRLLSTTHYSKTVGELMQATIGKVYDIVGESQPLQRTQCEQFTLNGDPAIRLYQYDKPDYVIEDKMVTVNPGFVSVAEPGFKVNATFMNLGKALDSTIVIELKRTFPDLSTTVVRRDTIRGIRYIDSLNYTLDIDPVKDKGLNKITITIDPENRIAELYENNNSITRDVFIFEDELRPVFPYNYSIINKQGIKFSASTANPLAVSRDYLFELDTTKLFNSSAKISQAKTSTGGVIEFNPSITFRDSTVYYWRVASVPAANEQPKWNTVSFIYINGPEVGFNQSHYYQFASNQYERMHLDSLTRQFKYNKVKHDITIRAGVFPTAFWQADQYNVTVDDNSHNSSVCGVSGIVFNVYNPNNLVPWVNSNPLQKSRYGSDTVCGPTRVWNFQYNILDANKRLNAAKFLDSIPDGSLVIVRNISGTDSASNTYANQWMADEASFGTGNTIYHKLKAQGFSAIDSFNRPRAFIFVYQKNNTSFTPITVFSEGVTDRISTSFNFWGIDSAGSFISPSFGPAKDWKKLQWSGTSPDNPFTDVPAVTLIGVRPNGVEERLMERIPVMQQDVDISAIDPIQYPNLKLEMYNSDGINHTPYQLKYWRLYYTPLPEGAVAPNIYFSFKDTLDVGEPLSFGVVFKNVSEYNFDSLKLKLNIRDKNNRENIINIAHQKPLAAGDTLKFTVPIATQQYTGRNTLFVEFNPDNHQPEQHHFNNFIYKDFFVRGDSANPHLDVTFDGVHILNRDIVSSKPDILIKLTDDAKWMLLNSNDLIKVQLKKPDGTMRDFAFDNDTLRFNAPTSGTNNVATVNFRPYLLKDGNYELIVLAKDQSGNTAGDMQYRVSFQVINKPMISNLLNYPNPFTTSTAFVFTLTGSELPQNLRIQILTITGKIVKEITKNELGPLKIGRNITEYKWDGTDQYGQKLANGVYLYRVITNLNGRALDKYTAPNDNTDRYFNKGYGKMYLMR